MARRLDARNLAIRAGQHALDIPALSIVRGETHCLIGKSGCGKSLLAAALAGLRTPGVDVAGKVLVDGSAAVAPLWKDVVFLLPQEPAVALDPTMPVGKQVGEVFRWRLAADCPWPDPRALARDIGLTPADLSRFPGELSGGMQQRVMIAMALAARAAFVIADEPTKGLDSRNKHRVIELIDRLKALGRGLVVITHDLDVVRALGDSVSVIDDGRIVEQRQAGDMLAAPRSAAARALVENQPACWPDGAASDAAATPPTIALSDIAFGFPGARLLFDGLSLEVGRGEIVGLFGPSGCGKSTLGDICLCLRTPSRGGVTWHGVPADRATVRQERTRFQKLFQNPVTAFPPNLRLGTVFSRLTPVPQERPDELSNLLYELDLDASLLDRRPDQVSGGELQRLAIVRVLLGEPDFIVCDEPSSRLDMSVQRQAVDMIASYVRERSAAALLISHDLQILRKRADRILELTDAGTLIPLEVEEEIRGHAA